MPTGSQDKSFAEEMSNSIEEVKLTNSALDVAIEWIAKNLNPNDVFTDSDLEYWAEKNGYVKKEND